MDDKTIRDNDAYDELLRNFSASKNNDLSDNDVKNHGEIYFSMNSQPTARNPRSSAKKAGSTANLSSPGAKRTTTGASSQRSKAVNNNPTVKKKTKKKKRNSSLKNSIMAIVIVVIVFISAFLIKIPIMGCVNDILAIDVSKTDFRVVLDEDMDCFDVIDKLAEKNLINNPMFCKLFAKIRSFDVKTDSNNNKKTIIYPAGTYFLNSGMGVEGMLNEIRTNGVEENTIKLTFPEGYSIDQIFEKLDDNGVCSASSLYEAMVSDELFERYEFLSSVTEKQMRYRVLEGYLYPDTYEFYLGESPVSVLERFLNHFENRWNETYQAKANELGYTVDEIITVAAILEKEAFDAGQMPVIASIIYNRLDSSSFPFINCDSTAQYIENYKDSLEANGKYAEYMKVYDTYQKTGLPVGPICCPGADAIYSALHPESTDYYYFLHDKEGNIYLASTAEEHQNNLQYLE
ncbi:MAG: endolytic transglycosylase MltG [Clostridia bacterium]|nr:endolytic transglycosylase MltG [Clostridia bacterium]